MKKGELTFETIVIAILVLLVLVILIIAYHSQLAELFSYFNNIISSTTESAKDIKLK